jgi:hypothetical protein
MTTGRINQVSSLNCSTRRQKDERHQAAKTLQSKDKRRKRELLREQLPNAQLPNQRNQPEAATEQRNHCGVMTRFSRVGSRRARLTVLCVEAYSAQRV